MAISLEIERILTERHEKATCLLRRIQMLSELRKKLVGSRAALSTETRRISDEALRSEIKESTGPIEAEIAGLIVALDDLLEKMEHGADRFGRGSITIAAIGRTRQGKSRLLQTLGGLDSRIIPDGGSDDCTGAVSFVRNDPDLAPGEVQCRITFRRPEALLEMIRADIHTLDPAYLKTHTVDFRNISMLNVTALFESGDAADAARSCARDRLERIVEHFFDMRKYFGAGPISLTAPEQIRSFVARDSGLMNEAPDPERYAHYLAVERADIRCRFRADVGRLRLADTVGVGTARSGAEDAMLELLDRECDAVIVVCEPDGQGVQTADEALYLNLQNHFRDPAKRLFYLVNHHRGRNDDVVELFGNALRERNWRIADCRTADVSEPEEVTGRFLAPMVQILMDDMREVDGACLKSLREEESALIGRITGFFGAGLKVTPKDTNAQIKTELYQKGVKCSARMRDRLNTHLKHWSWCQNKPNQLLWNGIQRILEQLANDIPDADMIREICRSNGLHGDVAWETMLQLLRNRIAERFRRADGILEPELQSFRNILVQPLYRALLEAGLEEPADKDKVRWIRMMMDEHLQDPKYAQIRRALELLTDFEVRTGDYLIREVRRYLHIIDPGSPGSYLKPEHPFREETLGEEIHYLLVSRVALLEDELRWHLIRASNMPNLACCEAVEGFRDLLTCPVLCEGGILADMEHIWGSIFQEIGMALQEEDPARQETVDTMNDSLGRITGDLAAFLKDAAAETM